MSLKDFGKIQAKYKVFKKLQKDISKVDLMGIRGPKLVNFFGIMENITLVNGLKIKNTEMEYGNPRMVIYIWVHG